MSHGVPGHQHTVRPKGREEDGQGATQAKGGSGQAIKSSALEQAPMMAGEEIRTHVTLVVLRDNGVGAR